jgi:Zn ribbon nucleic-acid-binding protein
MTDDLISRQAAIDVAVQSIMDWDGMFIQEANCRIRDAINELPSAQPEIIRCKDCKYSEHLYRDKSRCFLWAEDGIDVFDDGFCNYAERRQDG